MSAKGKGRFALGPPALAVQRHTHPAQLSSARILASPYAPSTSLRRPAGQSAARPEQKAREEISAEKTSRKLQLPSSEGRAVGENRGAAEDFRFELHSERLPQGQTEQPRWKRRPHREEALLSKA